MQRSFRYHTHVVFDPPGPPVAPHISREELEAWLAREPLRPLSTRARNRGSSRFPAERT